MSLNNEQIQQKLTDKFGDARLVVVVAVVNGGDERFLYVS